MASKVVLSFHGTSWQTQEPDPALLLPSQFWWTADERCFSEAPQ